MTLYSLDSHALQHGAICGCRLRFGSCSVCRAAGSLCRVCCGCPGRWERLTNDCVHFPFFSAHSHPAFIGEEAGTDVLPFCANIILLACLDLTVNARIKEKIFQGSQQNYPEFVLSILTWESVDLGSFQMCYQLPGWLWLFNFLAFTQTVCKRKEWQNWFPRPLDSGISWPVSPFSGVI